MRQFAYLTTYGLVGPKAEAEVLRNAKVGLFAQTPLFELVPREVANVTVQEIK